MTSSEIAALRRLVSAHDPLMVRSEPWAPGILSIPIIQRPRLFSPANLKLFLDSSSYCSAHLHLLLLWQVILLKTPSMKTRVPG